MLAGYTPFEWLALVEHELLLFAGAFFLLGALDEMAVDAAWIWLKLRGRAITDRLPSADQSGTALRGRAAVFVPTWGEAAVIGATVRHTLTAWAHADLRLYIGCYRNDERTIAAVIEAAAGDPRLRLIVHDRAGPTTKADCLNRLYHALQQDEQREGRTARMIVLHDAEDMVDGAALGVLDRAMDDADFVQLPVLPQPQAASMWVGSHYCEEFAEAHGKTMVVRDALQVGLPSAGVGCAIARPAMQRYAARRPDGLPFASESLTEDYELGLGIAELGGRSRFLRCRDERGRLVATRAYFPEHLATSVRQKTRWVHGIALQGWDRMGWGDGAAEVWMRMRDRRGPLTALVLACAYGLLVLSTIGWVAHWAGAGVAMPLDPGLKLLLLANFASFLWRTAFRFAFTAREYGWQQGVMAILRIPVANIIAIMSGRRALVAYARTLSGQLPSWDKTEHRLHPSVNKPAEANA